MPEVLDCTASGIRKGDEPIRKGFFAEFRVLNTAKLEMVKRCSGRAPPRPAETGSRRPAAIKRKVTAFCPLRERHPLPTLNFRHFKVFYYCIAGACFAMQSGLNLAG